METQNSSLTCVICLECFNYPVTIPCGHTFCKDCISMYWDTKSKSNIGPQCPFCNEQFSTRPSLNRNTSLSVLSEAAHSSASSCRQPEVRAGEGLTATLLCPRHKKPFVYYCRQDKMPVCCQCGIAECKHHETVLLDTQRDSQELLLQRNSEEVEKLLEDTQRSISELTDNINQAQVSLQKTSTWMKDKVSSLMKGLSEQQQAVELFISQQREVSLTEAQARLSQLQDRSQILQASRDQIAAVRSLPDLDLIRESTLVVVPCFKDISTDVCPKLQDGLNGVMDVLSRLSKLLCEDLDKAVSTAVGQDHDSSPQDKRPVLAVVPSAAAVSVPGRNEGLSAYRCCLTFDPRTANGHLVLSQDNQRAEHLTSGPHPVPAHQARFDHT
ncbi:tripartite motif-containing protein 65 [Austrofundulus limnaeus]|uniref:Tripartite motif-containing protein 65 n=1 Tax=Austrofundulus limnaeus TaxID=52670 RepID=A0A2I4AK03_AUSLI|nr:PREDICTED: tripartite motif-containing protein 65-like [Austrofundulus limnaeus]